MAQGRKAARRLVPAVVVSALAMAGCAIVPTFTTGYDVVRESASGRIDASLAVRRFADERPQRVYTAQDRLFLTAVPLLRSVSLPFERMDENVHALSEEIAAGDTSGAAQSMPIAPDFASYAYPDSVARAIADDLRQHGLFREVTYVGDGSVAGERYVLDGVLRASPLERVATSYYMGAVGVLFWILPIPTGKVSGAVDVSLSLRDAASDAILWRRDLHGAVSRLISFYTSSGVSYGTSGSSYQMVLPPADARVDRHSLFAWHFEALRRAMAEATPDLIATMARAQ